MIEGYLAVFMFGITVGVGLTLYAKGFATRKASSKRKPIQRKSKRFHIGWR